MVLPHACDMAFLSVYQMNQKFFDQEDQFQDEVATQQVDKDMGLADMMIK